MTEVDRIRDRLLGVSDDNYSREDMAHDMGWLLDEIQQWRAMVVQLERAIEDEQYKSIEAQRQSKAALAHNNSLLLTIDALRSKTDEPTCGWFNGLWCERPGHWGPPTSP